MPFAGYKDFADCVAKNAKQRDPKAYCAVIMRKTEGKQPIIRQPKAHGARR